MPLFCSKLSEFPISLSMKAKFLQMNHKAPHNPNTLTFSLHPSHTRTLTNTEACSNLTDFALLAPSAWAPLPPDFSLEHPFIPCMYLFKCHLLCEAFSGCNIYNYSLHTQNFLSLPSFIFLQRTIASQAVHIPPRNRRKLNHSQKEPLRHPWSSASFSWKLYKVTRLDSFYISLEIGH